MHHGQIIDHDDPHTFLFMIIMIYPDPDGDHHNLS